MTDPAQTGPVQTGPVQTGPVQTGRPSSDAGGLPASPLAFSGEEIPYVAQIDETVDPAALGVLELATAELLRVVPIAADEGTVTIAVADPSDLVALDDLQMRLAPRTATLLHTDADVVDRMLRSWAQRNARAAETEAVRDLAVDVAGIDVGEESTTDDGRVAGLVTTMLEQAVAAGASDVHLEPVHNELVVRFRLDGVLHRHTSYPVALAPGLINRIKVMAEMEITEKRMPLDGRFHRTLMGREIDCRVVSLPTASRYEGAVLRLMDQSRSTLTLTDVGFNPSVANPFLRALANPHGMILVTGPTGSGKTTSLYAALSQVARVDRKVLTIEDPVEITFPSVTQVQVREKAGLTFASALRSFLRADPDVILVGEIRDRETAELAAQASMTGHLVLSTLHTNDAASAPTRLADIGLDNFTTAAALRGVLAQRLLRRLCDRCARPVTTTQGMLEQVGWDPHALAVPDQLRAASDSGCEHCGGRGYAGRVVVGEMVTVTDEIATAIGNRAPAREIEQLARTAGSTSLKHDALRFVAAGTTSLDEIRRMGLG